MLMCLCVSFEIEPGDPFYRDASPAPKPVSQFSHTSRLHTQLIIINLIYTSFVPRPLPSSIQDLLVGKILRCVVICGVQNGH